TGGFKEPLYFILKVLGIYFGLGLIEVLIKGGNQLWALVGSGFGFLFMGGFIIIGLFFGAFIWYLIAAVFGGKGSYEGTFRVLCYQGSAFGITVYLFNFIIGLIIAGMTAGYSFSLNPVKLASSGIVILSLFVLYGFWMLFVQFLGFKKVHKFTNLIAGIIVFGPYLFGAGITVARGFTEFGPALIQKIKGNKSEKIKEVKTGDILERGGNKFTVGKDKKIIGTVDSISGFDNGVFVAKISLDDITDDYLVMANNSGVKTALNSMLKKGYKILMHGKNLSPEETKRGTRYFYCKYISFKSLYFGEKPLSGKEALLSKYEFPSFCVEKYISKKRNRYVYMNFSKGELKKIRIDIVDLEKSFEEDIKDTESQLINKNPDFNIDGYEIYLKREEKNITYYIKPVKQNDFYFKAAFSADESFHKHRGDFKKSLKEWLG
ncbi:MAG: YIP1 family protein, partial [Elusimicrobiota bacterium]